MLIESSTVAKITSFVKELSEKSTRNFLRLLNKSVDKNTVTISEITALANKVGNERNSV